METEKKIAVKTKLPLLKGRGEVEINFETVDIYSLGYDLSQIINKVNESLSAYINVEPMDESVDEHAELDNFASKLEVCTDPTVQFSPRGYINPMAALQSEPLRNQANVERHSVGGRYGNEEVVLNLREYDSKLPSEDTRKD